jgi:hypothetical protein
MAESHDTNHTAFCHPREISFTASLSDFDTLSDSKIEEEDGWTRLSGFSSFFISAIKTIAAAQAV